jgi:hypothetical protein
MTKAELQSALAAAAQTDKKTAGVFRLNSNKGTKSLTGP